MCWRNIWMFPYSSSENARSPKPLFNGVCTYLMKWSGYKNGESAYSAQGVSIKGLINKNNRGVSSNVKLGGQVAKYAAAARWRLLFCQNNGGNCPPASNTPLNKAGVCCGPCNPSKWGKLNFVFQQYFNVIYGHPIYSCHSTYLTYLWT